MGLEAYRAAPRLREAANAKRVSNFGDKGAGFKTFDLLDDVSLKWRDLSDTIELMARQVIDRAPAVIMFNSWRKVQYVTNVSSPSGLTRHR
jgi:hypothetical protein